VAQVAVTAAQAGHRVINVTLEDSAQLYSHRFLARLSGVPFGLIHNNLLTEQQRERVLATRVLPYAANIRVVDDVEPRWDRVQAGVKACGGCDLLILDYVQMLGRDPSVLDQAVFGAQMFAKENNMAIIFISQQVKHDKADDNPRPKTENMFGSSALRMGTKVAIGLFRPSDHCKAPTNAKGPYGNYVRWISSHPDHAELYPNLLEVHITKNYAGPAAAYHVLVEADTGLITPYEIPGFA
jgi:hypothetical protein